MVGLGVETAAVRSSISMETTCGALLQELEKIWTEIGETEDDKDRMFLELEMECMQVYRKKVDEASSVRARIHQSLVAKEAELATLIASLGETSIQLKIEKKPASLKEQIAIVAPLLDDVKNKQKERLKQFADIRSQIDKIKSEISGLDHQHESRKKSVEVEEHDLSLRKLTELQSHLRNLQKEKSDRLHKVLERVNELHSLCGVLGVDFGKTVDEVHPSLHETGAGHSTNISDTTLEALSQALVKLKTEKKIRTQKLREAAGSLLKLWNLMDTSHEERRPFAKVANILESSEQDVTCSGLLLLETIKQIEAEVERLMKLKASRMKELVLKKRLELEDICRDAHIEPDTNTAQEKVSALIDSGLVDPSELLASIESQILKAKEESMIRKDIMDNVNKWLAACEEENWLEEYNKDENRYSAGRGVHLNLKRAEKARVTVSKIPAIVENLISKVFSWEDEKSMPFLYDGVRLIAILEEYKVTRKQKEEEKRRFRDQKKLQNQLLTEKEALYGSKPSPKKINSFSRKTNVHHANGNGNGFMTPAPRRVSVGSTTPELLTARSHSGRYNSYLKETRRFSTAPLNFVAISKEDTMSSFTSVSGSEPGSPPLN